MVVHFRLGIAQLTTTLHRRACQAGRRVFLRHFTRIVGNRHHRKNHNWYFRFSANFPNRTTWNFCARPVILQLNLWVSFGFTRRRQVARQSRVPNTFYHLGANGAHDNGCITFIITAVGGRHRHLTTRNSGNFHPHFARNFHFNKSVRRIHFTDNISVNRLQRACFFGYK